MRDDFVDDAVAAGVRDERVLAALGAVPRRLFVPPSTSARSLRRDAPVPLPSGQTTSQPSLIALMVEALDPDPDNRVLEIGTGYGYEAAVLSRLVREVWTVEWWQELADAAAENLTGFGAPNVHVRVGDGRAGVPEHAPYDGIIVAAQTRAVPAALVAQLAVGGRLVAPVGAVDEERCLVHVRRASGALEVVDDLGRVRFVPLLAQT